MNNGSLLTNNDDTMITNSRSPSGTNIKLMKVLFLQSLYRGNRARKDIAYLHKKKVAQANGTGKYFTFEEAVESVTQQGSNETGKRVKR